MFKAKRVEVLTVHELFVVLHEFDAMELGFSPKDRVFVKNERTGKGVVCELEVFDSTKRSSETQELKLNRGEIGVFNLAFEKLELFENDEISVVPAKRPYSLDFVKEKFKGKKFNEESLIAIMNDVVENKYSPVETTYFVIACSVVGLDDDEVVALTNAMVAVGKFLDFRKTGKEIIVDKHCIGGIPGNRTTLVIVPIVAAGGLVIPKTSSRSITSPAGTADTMEVFASVSLSLNKMHSVVEKTGGCMVWGGGLDLSPADDIIIQVEHPLEIDSEGQMIASILSKKKSAGSNCVLLDIPIGPTAKVSSLSDGKELAGRFERIGKRVGLDVRCIFTDGSEPIGYGVGPYLEALDVLKVLKNEAGQSLKFREKCLSMAGQIFEMAQKCKAGKGYEMAKEILDSGRALAKFDEIRNAQGRKDLPKKAMFSFEVKSEVDGKVIAINNKWISKLAFVLGAPQDVTAGVLFGKKVGDLVVSGDVLVTLFTNSELRLDYAKSFVKENFPFMFD